MEKIKWGVLGTANIARKQLIPALKLADNAELIGIAGRNQDKVKKFQQEFMIPKGYYSLEELLADPEIEAVYIPLPNTLHKEWAIKAVQAGKHVLCEKPFAGNLADSLDMIKAAEENGVFIMEAFAYLHSPVIRSIRETLDSKVIGKPKFIETCFFTAGYTEENIRARRDTLGGAIYDLGCYCTSLVLSLIDSEPVKINAMANFTRQQVDDMAAAFIEFDDGCRSVITTGMCSPQRSDRFFIHGSKGTIEAPVPFNAMGRLSYNVVLSDRTITYDVDVRNNYAYEVEQFGRCVRGLESPFVSNDFTLRNAGVIDRILSSMGYTE